MVIECPCGEDVSELAAYYSRQKDIDQIRCDDCLDIMTRKLWRIEVIQIRRKDIKDASIKKDEIN